jgi:uncharacterized protein YaiL (DUF2058 family)
MSDSLKDQLKALGLAPKPVKREFKRPPKPHKPKPVKAAKLDPDNISLDQAYRMRSQQERQQKQQAAERKQAEERRRRETNQKIKALINEHAVKDKAAEIKRNFLYKGRIRSVLVNPEQLKQINGGTLAVIYLSGNHHLMPVEIVEKVRDFAPDNVPDLQGAQSAEEEDHPVPDDLIW